MIELYRGVNMSKYYYAVKKMEEIQEFMKPGVSAKKK